MEGCIFCRVAAGDVPATVVKRSEGVVAIEDREPQAPSHLLVMPVAHYATIVDLFAADAALGARLMAVAAELGRERGGEDGFRLVVNTGARGGQTVGHVHVHVLSGRAMTWPPG